MRELLINSEFSHKLEITKENIKTDKSEQRNKSISLPPLAPLQKKISSEKTLME